MARVHRSLRAKAELVACLALLVACNEILGIKKYEPRPAATCIESCGAPGDETTGGSADTGTGGSTDMTTGGTSDITAGGATDTGAGGTSDTATGGMPDIPAGGSAGATVEDGNGGEAG